MNLAIVNKPLSVTLFILFLLCFVSDNAYSQIINYDRDYKESIIIPHNPDERINVFIFISSGTKKSETNRLVNNMNALEALSLINFDAFNIYKISITENDSAPICVLKNVVLDGYDMNASFSYDPYYIIVETCPMYDELIKKRPKFRKEPTVTSVTNKSSEKSQFVSFSDDRVFMEFIKRDITSANDSVLNNQIVELTNTIDSLKKQRAENTSISKHFFSIYYSLPISFSLSGLDNSKIQYDRNGGISISADLKLATTKRKIGAGISLNYSQSSFNLSSTEPYVDTIPWVLTDNAGDFYKGIIYADSIDEKVSLTTFSIIPHVSFRIQPFGPKWNIFCSPGIKISSVLAANYSAKNGKMAFGGLYTQDETDTLFSDKKVFNSAEQNLKMRDVLVSLSLPAALYYHYKNNWYLNVGISYEIGFSNILNNDLADKNISLNQNDYNSLLYRHSHIRINTLSFQIGVAYLF